MRTIKTVYFNGADVMRTNTSADVNRAVAQCVYHMQINHYGASAAEVYDGEDMILHAQIRLWKDGSIKIVYKRDPQEFENKYTSAVLLEQK